MVCADQAGMGTSDPSDLSVVFSWLTGLADHPMVGECVTYVLRAQSMVLDSLQDKCELTALANGAFAARAPCH